MRLEDCIVPVFVAIDFCVTSSLVDNDVLHALPPIRVASLYHTLFMKDNHRHHTRKKWFTCTPVPFKGDHTFFHRDSGLFCRAFQEIGVESRAVMPLPAQEGDCLDLIITEYKNLQSAEWCRSQNIDGVVLYAWTKTRYTAIARAIHNSGAKLVLYLDVGALTYPWKDWMFGTKLIFRSNRIKHPVLFIPYALLEILREHTLKQVNSIRRRRHLDYADIIGIPSPPAIEAYKRIPFLFSKKSRAAITLLPAPVASHFTYNPNIQKEDRIMAVGRWDDEETKRPRFVMNAVESFCHQNGSFHIDIFGVPTIGMKTWYDRLPASMQPRISLHGVVGNDKLAFWYQRSKICLCASVRESTHLASMEAVCCGCSIVAAPTPGLAAVHWYASKNSGTIAEKDNPEAFAAAMTKEHHAWESGARHPEQISDDWRELLHAKHSATLIITLLSGQHLQ